MKFLYSIIFLFFVPFALNGQLISNVNGEAFEEQPYFNQEFIKKNKIKIISGRFLFYQLGDQLRNTEYYQKYFFNEEGQLIKEEKMDKGGEAKGPLFTDYKYDKNGNLLSVISQNSTSIFGYFYKYDEDNRKINIEYRQNYSSKEKGLGKEYVISSHKNSYAKYDNQLHKTVYNESGFPYLKVIHFYDDSTSLLREIEETLIRSKNRKRHNYFYDDKGHLKKIVTVFNDGKNTNEIVFEYKKDGRIASRSESNDNKPVKTTEVIYKNDSQFINDILIKDEINNFIKVVELRQYEYY
ncbi:MAG: hypothetical protein WC994_09330 [Brumimicrobium sp.]